MYALSVLKNNWQNWLIVRPTEKMLREVVKDLNVLEGARAWGFTDDKGNWAEGFHTGECLSPGSSMFDMVHVSFCP